MNIGDVIYVVIQRAIVPHMVVGEMTSKTVNGTQISWSVENSRGETITIKKGEAEFYASIEEARIKLVSKAEAAIEKLLTKAKNESAQAFGKAMKERATFKIDPSQEVEGIADEDPELVEMPDGSKVKFKLSPEAAAALGTTK